MKAVPQRSQPDLSGALFVSLGKKPWHKKAGTEGG